MFCKHCGNQINEKVTFCSSCGKKLEDSSSKQSKEVKQEKNLFSKKWWKYKKLTKNEYGYSGVLLIIAATIFVNSVLGTIFLFFGIGFLISWWLEKKKK